MSFIGAMHIKGSDAICLLIAVMQRNNIRIFTIEQPQMQIPAVSKDVFNLSLFCDFPISPSHRVLLSASMPDFLLLRIPLLHAGSL